MGRKCISNVDKCFEMSNNKQELKLDGGDTEWELGNGTSAFCARFWLFLP